MFGGDDLSKNLLICDLLELYGPLLTEKQSRLLELYYFDDLSLSEIAENEGGSRQGAMDVIKRAEKELLKMEDTLGLYNRNKQQTEILNSAKIALDEKNFEKIKSLLSDFEKTPLADAADASKKMVYAAKAQRFSHGEERIGRQ